MKLFNESPPWGAFNKIINDRHLKEIAEYIQGFVPENAWKWGMPCITKDNCVKAELGGISLYRTKSLHVYEDTLIFCCELTCLFTFCPGEDIDDAGGTYIDVFGTILFHPPGTKKYDFRIKGYHCEKDRHGHYPENLGVIVNQNLYPAFGYVDEQAHKILEAEAERFLRQFYPDALHHVIPVPIRMIAEEKMNLQVYTGYHIPTDDDTFGQMVFQTQTVSVVDEETGNLEKIKFPRGSILIDADLIWNRGYGSFNFTIAHEVYHWYAHRVHKAFVDIMGELHGYQDMIDKMESQANKLASRILMPAHSVKVKYREAQELYADANETDNYEMSVAYCASFFHVSKTAMKIRLNDLGLHRRFRNPSVRLRLDIVEMFSRYAEDKTFRELLDTGMYKYIKGYVIRNDPKYIANGRMTDYARQHPEECFMRFSEDYSRSQDDETGYSMYRKDAYFSLKADYDFRMKHDPEMMGQFKHRLAAMKEKFVAGFGDEKSFCQFILPIIMDINTKEMGIDITDSVDDALAEGKMPLGKKNRIRRFDVYDFQSGKTRKVAEDEIFQNRTLVRYKEFGRILRDKWNDLKLDLAMAVCAGYHLDIATTEEALRHAGYILTYYNTTHLAYRFLVSHCRDQYKDTGTFNTLLLLLGEKAIGSERRNKDKTGQ